MIFNLLNKECQLKLIINVRKDAYLETMEILIKTLMEIILLGSKTLYLSIILFLTFQVEAIEVGKWNFVVEENYCYIGSAPTKEEGDYTNRDITYVLVYRINKSQNKLW